MHMIGSMFVLLSCAWQSHACQGVRQDGHGGAVEEEGQTVVCPPAQIDGTCRSLNGWCIARQTYNRTVMIALEHVVA